MTFDYIKFAEEWASLYKPMHHTLTNDTNQRFFITDSYMTMRDFMTHMDPSSSPCVITESQQEGNVDDGWDYPRYSYYFMVRADEVVGGKEAVRAKKDAKSIMMDFINFVRCFKNAYEDENQQAILSRLPLNKDGYLYQLRSSVKDGDRCMENIEIDSYTYESLNEVYDGWYGIQFTLDDKQLINLCADSSLYG